MRTDRIEIQGIPVIVWGELSDKVYLCVHGKMSSKESMAGLAAIAQEKGYQTLSFDLPQHGERKGESNRCDIWNGMHDLAVIGEYAFAHWKDVHLYACSLGAFFSLHTYHKHHFQKCLFQSPILDMEYLIGQMMAWFSVTEEQLEREQEVDTSIDVLSWEYWQYVKAHPICKWNPPTCILFGGKDNLQSRQVVNNFVQRFGCKLTVSERSEHPFMKAEDILIVEQWLWDNI